jgi:hypothetical protein
VSCFPHPNCTDKVGLEWNLGACPDPSQDRIRFIIDGDPYAFACNQASAFQAGYQEIDASRWVGSTVDVVIEIIDASGNILESAHQSAVISSTYESGDYQCESPTISFYVVTPDAGTD